MEFLSVKSCFIGKRNVAGLDSLTGPLPSRIMGTITVDIIRHNRVLKGRSTI